MRFTLLLLVACSGKSSDLIPVSDTASDVVIRKVTFNQGVSITMRDDQFGVPPVQPPVVAYRDGLVRVHVDVDAEAWEPREIAAVLEVDSAPFASQEVLVQHVEGDSLELERDTTFDFVVPGYAIQPGVDFSVRLLESDGRSGDPANERASFRSSEGPWTFVSTGLLRVELLPISYGADGSDRMPDISPAQLALYQDRLSSLYPANEVQVVVRPGLAWDAPVLNNGAGWETLLAEVAAQRAAANVPDNTYFYGVFEPDVDEASYCAAGCVLGLSNFGTVADAETRSSIGLGFAGMSSADTLAHELGHAHGRLHAPCGGAQGVDPEFPSAAGSIGAWGWDINSDALVSPSEGRDLMGYCSPVWVSGYTWTAFAERIGALNQRPMARQDVEPTLWQRFVVESDGRIAAFGKPESRVDPIIGALRKVEVEIDGDIVVREARWFPSSHLSSGMLMLEAEGLKPQAHVTVLD